MEGQAKETVPRLARVLLEPKPGHHNETQESFTVLRVSSVVFGKVL